MGREVRDWRRGAVHKRQQSTRHRSRRIRACGTRERERQWVDGQALEWRTG